MERDSSTIQRFEEFNYNLRNFIDEQSDMYAKPYTKDKLIKKVDML
jgi:hypothetical protein